MHHLQRRGHTESNERGDHVRIHERLGDLSLLLVVEVCHVCYGGECESWGTDVADGEDEDEDGVGGLWVRVSESSALRHLRSRLLTMR